MPIERAALAKSPHELLERPRVVDPIQTVCSVERDQILRILRSEKYVGNLVYGRALGRRGGARRQENSLTQTWEPTPMAILTVYRFQLYDRATDEMMTSRRWGTLVGIERIKGDRLCLRLLRSTTSTWERGIGTHRERYWSKSRSDCFAATRPTPGYLS